MSGLEIIQNKVGQAWDREEVQERLQNIMRVSLVSIDSPGAVHVLVRLLFLGRVEEHLQQTT